MHRPDRSVEEAVVATVSTAGRAVFFSGLTVLIGLSGLALFDFMFLRSVGIAGVVVVFFSVAAALTLLPAVLGVIGTRIDSLRVLPKRQATEGAQRKLWARLSYAVMRHPVAVLVPTLGLLLLLGRPFLNVVVSSPDATILPRSLPSRQGFDILTESYGPGEISPFVIAVQSPTSMLERSNLGALYDLTKWLKQQPGVARVKAVTAFEEPVTREQAIAAVSLQRAAAGWESTRASIGCYPIEPRWCLSIPTTSRIRALTNAC